MSAYFLFYKPVLTLVIANYPPKVAASGVIFLKKGGIFCENLCLEYNRYPQQHTQRSGFRQLQDMGRICSNAAPHYLHELLNIHKPLSKVSAITVVVNRGVINPLTKGRIFPVKRKRTGIN